MYYGFVDGRFVGSANHISYLKKWLDEDLALFGYGFAVIYCGKKSVQCKSSGGEWSWFKSEKACRPEIR